jgi:manganese/zinc/iron transport system permease protein
VKEDAAIGLVFPVLFSIGVVLIARYAGDVHLDTDAVLLGELAFAPFDRMVVGGYDLGPRALYVTGSVGLLNALFIVLFYKELKLATFDAALAASLGFAPAVLHYVLMGLVSVTAVAAFDAVGSVLVVALMIGPAATAHLLTDRLPAMIGLGLGFSAASALGGYWLAHALDASIAGAMATTVGVLFGAVYLLAPERGLVALARRRARQRWTFAGVMLAIHLMHHEGGPEAAEESRVAHLQEHLGWTAPFATQVVRRAVQDGLVRRDDGHLILTDEGRARAREALVQG